LYRRHNNGEQVTAKSIPSRHQSGYWRNFGAYDRMKKKLSLEQGFPGDWVTTKADRGSKMAICRRNWRATIRVCESVMPIKLCPAVTSRADA
jgi:hypothetical protein